MLAHFGKLDVGGSFPSLKLGPVPNVLEKFYVNRTVARLLKHFLTFSNEIRYGMYLCNLQRTGFIFSSPGR
jgi:hypothetical protein